jgi:hypothetical protein
VIAAPSTRLGAFLVACLAAAFAPFWCGENPVKRAPADAFSGWPNDIFGDDRVQPVSLGEREARFAADFPGRIEVFSTGERTYVLRWIEHPTRRLHPASDCLRALGFAVRPAPLFATPDGHRWSTTLASRDGKSEYVHERIFDQAGREWTDVSAWFWTAALGRTRGPWCAVTVIGRAEHAQ